MKMQFFYRNLLKREKLPSLRIPRRDPVAPLKARTGTKNNRLYPLFPYPYLPLTPKSPWISQYVILPTVTAALTSCFQVVWSFDGNRCRSIVWRGKNAPGSVPYPDREVEARSPLWKVATGTRDNRRTCVHRLAASPPVSWHLVDVECKGRKRVEQWESERVRARPQLPSQRAARER